MLLNSLKTLTMHGFTMKSKIYIQSSTPWCSADSELALDYELLKWAGPLSLSARSEKAVNFFKAFKLDVIIDLGCGTGHFLASIAREQSFNALIGVEPDPVIFKRLISRTNGLNLSLKQIDIESFLQSEGSNYAHQCLGVSLIGVLQNCCCNPFDLLSSILSILKPACLFMTTKATCCLSDLDKYDPKSSLYSLFYEPELLQLLQLNGYQVDIIELDFSEGGQLGKSQNRIFQCKKNTNILGLSDQGI